MIAFFTKAVAIERGSTPANPATVRDLTQVILTGLDAHSWSRAILVSSFRQDELRRGTGVFSAGQLLEDAGFDMRGLTAMAAQVRRFGIDAGLAGA